MIGISPRSTTILKNDLGCKHPIKGTQANSDYSSFFTQAKCDFLDVHGYWQHPRNAQDRRNWTINNVPMVNASGSTVVGLAMCRVKGKPFNVSEYGHPAPNTYCSEEIPTVTSFAALAGLGRDHALHLRAASAPEQRYDHQLFRAQEPSDEAGDDAVRRAGFSPRRRRARHGGGVRRDHAGRPRSKPPAGT